MLELIDFEFLMLCEISELAHIAYYNRDTSNAYVDYCEQYSEFSFCKPVRPEFLAILDDTDKEIIVNMILGSESATKKAYVDFIECDEDMEVA